MLTLEEQIVIRKLESALGEFYNIRAIADSIHSEHTNNTPIRVVASMVKMFEGCWQDPKQVLHTVFSDSVYDQLIYVNSISFVSNCAHHNLPFFGKAHFAYLPDKKIVGLSKIPRLVEVYSKRPQVQEKLTCEIVDTFMEVLEPIGCGLVMEAYHLCMSIRGVENQSAYTRTTALRGCFKDNESTKEEFLHGIQKVTNQIWP